MKKIKAVKSELEQSKLLDHSPTFPIILTPRTSENYSNIQKIKF